MLHYQSRAHNLPRKIAYADALGCTVYELPFVLARMYEKEFMSAQEIADLLKEKTHHAINARSILRLLKPLGVVRKNGDAYRLAAKRGRIKWATKDAKTQTRYKRIGGASGAKIRYAVLKRDGFKCVGCGATPQETTLEVDHIVALVNGGTNHVDNLRTLCTACNVGKRLAENER